MLTFLTGVAESTITLFALDDGTVQNTYTCSDDSTWQPMGNPILAGNRIYVPFHDGGLGSAGGGLAVFDQNLNLLATQSYTYDTVVPFPGMTGQDYVVNTTTTSLFNFSPNLYGGSYGWQYPLPSNDGLGYEMGTLYFPGSNLFVPVRAMTSQVIAWNATTGSRAWSINGSATSPNPYTFYTVLGGVGNRVLLEWELLELQSTTAQVMSLTYREAGNQLWLGSNNISSYITANGGPMTTDEANGYISTMFSSSSEATDVTAVMEQAQRRGYMLVDVATGLTVASWEQPGSSTVSAQLPPSYVVADGSAGGTIAVAQYGPTYLYVASNPVDFDTVLSIDTTGQYYADGVAIGPESLDTPPSAYRYYPPGIVVYGDGVEVGEPGLGQPWADGTYTYYALVQDTISYTMTQAPPFAWNPTNYVTDGNAIYFLPGGSADAATVACFDSQNLAAGPRWTQTLGANATASNGIIQGQRLTFWMSNAWFVLNTQNGSLLQSVPLTLTEPTQVLTDPLSDEAMMAFGQLVFYSQGSFSETEGVYSGSLYTMP